VVEGWREKTRRNRRPGYGERKIFDAIWQLDLKYDTVISVLPFDDNQFKTRRMPIILNAKRKLFFYEGRCRHIEPIKKGL
jgi:hypothetical protein